MRTVLPVLTRLGFVLILIAALWASPARAVTLTMEPLEPGRVVSAPCWSAPDFAFHYFPDVKGPYGGDESIGFPAYQVRTDFRIDGLTGTRLEGQTWLGAIRSPINLMRMEWIVGEAPNANVAFERQGVTGAMYTIPYSLAFSVRTDDPEGPCHVESASTLFGTEGFAGAFPGSDASGTPYWVVERLTESDGVHADLRFPATGYTVTGVTATLTGYPLGRYVGGGVPVAVPEAGALLLVAGGAPGGGPPPRFGAAENTSGGSGWGPPPRGGPKTMART